MVGHMLQELIKLLHFTEGEYNSLLAERVIYLFLKQEQLHPVEFDLQAEMDTLVDYLTKTGQLADVQRAIDLLSLHEVRSLEYIQLKKWKVKALVALRECYLAQHSHSQAKAVNSCVIAQLTGLVSRQDVILQSQLYAYCLRELIAAHKLIIERLERKKSHLEATEQLARTVSLIEAAPEDAKDAFQKELMLCYFKMGEQHHYLHYESYSQKYFQMAFHIATRLKDPLASTIKSRLSK